MARLYILTIILLAVSTLLLWHPTHAFFNDSATSDNNVLAAASSFPTATPSATPTPGPGDVVINEINWAGSNTDGDDEWVELKNTTNRDLSLFNWVIENLGSGATSSIAINDSNASISANGFFLISNFNKVSSRINTDPDLIMTAISLVNTGEQLRLKTSSTGALIDSANAATGAWFAGSDSTLRKSMERNTIPGDGTVSGSWHTATTHTNMDGNEATDEFGTPKAENGL